ARAPRPLAPGEEGVRLARRADDARGAGPPLHRRPRLQDQPAPQLARSRDRHAVPPRFRPFRLPAAAAHAPGSPGAGGNRRDRSDLRRAARAGSARDGDAAGAGGASRNGGPWRGGRDPGAPVSGGVGSCGLEWLAVYAPAARLSAAPVAWASFEALTFLSPSGARTTRAIDLPSVDFRRLNSSWRRSVLSLGTRAR